MSLIHLVHWNAAEAAERIDRLRELGYRVQGGVPSGPDELRRLYQTPPDLFLVDLSRLPSQGRDVAIGFRRAKATRRVPILFIEGDPAKTERIRRLLPDAVFAGWDEAGDTVRRAVHPVYKVTGAGPASGTRSHGAL